MTSEEIQRQAGRLREEQGLSKYRVSQDGVFSSVNAITRFESGVQTAQITTIERYLNYLGYKLEIVPK
ncbi:helix-turn-helix transcriptional regulator [uncultured Porphyromonas sp.]|uniref:helix-turn-helix domain-containing protein n=1 Tax=uncultured Porphyromonas sp. TaxID=159274 RepID=UPI002805FE69|nr:helix-turn-helix transcriptional regulator [uncultured Porphyromonas sp.]